MVVKEIYKHMDELHGWISENTEEIPIEKVVKDGNEELYLLKDKRWISKSQLIETWHKFIENHKNKYNIDRYFILYENDCLILHILVETVEIPEYLEYILENGRIYALQKVFIKFMSGSIKLPKI